MRDEYLLREFVLDMPVPQAKTKFKENLIISVRYYLT